MSIKRIPFHNYIREESECEGCPLSDQNRVWGEGHKDALLALCGEAPGAVEAERKRPFVGPAGKLLDEALLELKDDGIERRYLWVMNVISCRPPDNNFSHSDGVEAQRRCRPGFDGELAAIGANVIVLLGNNAMAAFGITAGVTKIRGTTFEHNSLRLLPTYHPSYVIRKGGKKSIEYEEFKGDIRYAWRLAVARGGRNSDGERTE